MKLIESCKSEDFAIKYLIKVPKSRKIPKETVGIEGTFIHLPEREDGKPKSILCLSSQVGCFYDCLMCANSRKPFYRCLSHEEINEQIKLILMQDNNLEKIRKEGAVEYAMMGIGEPLFGMNVIHAIQHHKKYVERTEFSIATVGAEGTISKLVKSSLPYPVRLELSLHFPNDTLRNQWILSVYPYRVKEPKLNIEKMLEEAEQFFRKTRKKITLNYMVIDGINNTPKSLEQLIALLKNREDKFYVKVMEPNHTSSLTESYKEELGVKETYSEKEFREKLQKRGIHATLFKSKGIDIKAGCGMMRLRDY